VEEIERQLGYRFRDARLLETALTHPSFGSDHRAPHYQRLEFLGDAVLELAISRYLYFELPNVSEGRLTRLRAELVREESLFRIAEKFRLGSLIRLSVGEEKSGGREKPSILSDVTEAIIGAVYLDGGADAAHEVVMRMFEGMLDPSDLKETLDAKTRLQEKLQSEGKMPVYELISAEGPPHDPVFTYAARAEGRTLGEGAGRSKQAAQQAAARAALKLIGEIS
jgi:ribonuclease-3